MIGRSRPTPNEKSGKSRHCELGGAQGSSRPCDKCCVADDEDRLRGGLAGVKVEDVKINSGVAPGCNPTTAVAPDPVGKGAVVVVAVVACLGLLPWLGASMFADEGATLYSAHLSWSNLWAQSQHVDLVLLPYYAIIHFWLMVSGNIEWVRALSLFAYFGTIVVVGWTGLRIAGRWCGIIAAVLTATSTLVVEKSLNARPYALSIFLVALCSLVLLKWLTDSRTRWMWVFSILALLATAMQLFSLLAPVSMLFAVLVVHPDLIVQRLRTLLAPLALLAFASIAWIAACIGEVGQVNWIANQSTATRLLAEVRGPLIGQVYGFLLFLVVVVIVTKVAIVWNPDTRNSIARRVSQDRNILALTVGWLLIPTVVLSIASFAHPIFADRYVATSAPAAALLVAFICVRAFPETLDPSRTSDRTANRKRQNRTMAILGAVAAVVLAIGYVGSASALQEDLQGPARYVAQHAQSGDVIALPDHALTSAIGYYLEKDNRLVPLWPQLGVRQRYVEGFDLSSHPPSPGTFPRRLWLVWDGSVPGVVRWARTLERDGYVILRVKRFNGSSAWLFGFLRPATTVIIPSSGATLSGTNAVLGATASGNGLNVTKVQFALSGGPYSHTVIGRAGFTGAGALFEWNTTTVPNGTYALQSLATNAAGKTSYSPAITVKVGN